MRRHFGTVPDFIGGENVIVGTDAMISIDDIAGGLVIRTSEGDIDFTEAVVLAPCREFTSQLLGLAAPAEQDDILADIEFLAEGMRGFGVGVEGGPYLVAPGDEVWSR